MKIKLKEAMDALHENENIAPGYSNVQVNIHRDDGGKEKLTWKIYAYDSQDPQDGNVWSDECETFELALENIVANFEQNRRPKTKFVA